ncbi:MAG: UDP-3-O-acyl-N-acetylglucosamine deacetylase [Acidobacteriota bacterium]
MARQVLIVDDQPNILATLKSVLEDEGFETVCTASGEQALEIYQSERPDVVLLDIWLPDRDGLETLQAIKGLDSQAAVVMISGHGTTSTAVKAIKMGAADYLEKPLSYERVLRAVTDALEQKEGPTTGIFRIKAGIVHPKRALQAPPPLPLNQVGELPQRTIESNTVIYGHGLHSGRRTGMVLQPLPPDSGLHVLTVPNGVEIAVTVDSVADTDYATTLQREGEAIRTIEHLLSALHAVGITNLLIKVHGEFPILDGSSREFCDRLDEVGVVDQAAPRQEIVIDRVYQVGEGEKFLRIEPGEGFEVSYHLSYPPPVGDQTYSFQLGDWDSYREEIAPARTFGFMRDLKMLNELGLGSGGRLDNFILVGEDNVLNTELRFPDEFARHKILDIIGDLYLLGYPLRGKVTAQRTGHRDNIDLLRTLRAAHGL